MICVGGASSVAAEVLYRQSEYFSLALGTQMSTERKQKTREQVGSVRRLAALHCITYHVLCELSNRGIFWTRGGTDHDFEIKQGFVTHSV